MPTVAPAVESTMTAAATANPIRIREDAPGTGSDPRRRSLTATRA
jgi:hypothetical protein